MNNKANAGADDALTEFRREIFANLNCVSIGKISSVDISTQTCEIEIQFKKRINETDTADYPVLVDCPFFVLQGSGAFIEIPIATGDFCIVLFNDRCIDAWFENGTVAVPDYKRKHSLSDAIAIVGIDNKNSVKDLTGNTLQIISNDLPISVDAGSKDISIDTTGNINFKGATESFVKGDTLKTLLTTLCASVSAATSGTTAQNAAGIETIKTAFSTFNSNLSNIVSSTIKGE